MNIKNVTIRNKSILILSGRQTQSAFEHIIIIIIIIINEFHRDASLKQNFRAAEYTLCM